MIAYRHLIGSAKDDNGNHIPLPGVPDDAMGLPELQCTNDWLLLRATGIVEDPGWPMEKAKEACVERFAEFKYKDAYINAEFTLGDGRKISTSYAAEKDEQLFIDSTTALKKCVTYCKSVRDDINYFFYSAVPARDTSWGIIADVEEGDAPLNYKWRGNMMRRWRNMNTRLLSLANHADTISVCGYRRLKSLEGWKKRITACSIEARQYEKPIAVWVQPVVSSKSDPYLGQPYTRRVWKEMLEHCCENFDMIIVADYFSKHWKNIDQLAGLTNDILMDSRY